MKLQNTTTRNITFSDTGKPVKFVERLSVAASSSPGIEVENITPQALFNQHFQNQVVAGDLVLDFETYNDVGQAHVGTIRKFLEGQTDFDKTLVSPATCMYTAIDASSTITIVDVSNPYDWYNILGTYATPSIVSNQPDACKIGNSIYLLYPTLGSGLLILDVTDPANPTLVSTEATAANIYGVQVSGNYAYMISATTLYVVDISDPTTPTIVGSVAPAGMVGAVVLAVNGARVYIAESGSGYYIIDVTDPTAPTLLGTTSGGTIGDSWTIANYGNYTLIGQGTLVSGGLEVIDNTDETTPISIANIYPGIIIMGLTIDNDVAYLSTSGATYSMPLTGDPLSWTPALLYASYYGYMKVLGTHLFGVGAGVRGIDIASLSGGTDMGIVLFLGVNYYGVLY